jgi:glycosyltransferase involved in cell wall biosynthesis
MKIAFVNQPWSMVLPPVQAGSISIWTWEVARRLAKYHQVLAYEGFKHYKPPKVAPCEGVAYRVFWTGIDHVLMKLWARVRPHEPVDRQVSARALYYLTYAIQVALDIRRERCDVVHIHQCSQFAPVIRAFNRNSKIVLHMNCEWLTQFDYDLVDRRLRHVDVILGCSNHIANLIRERFPHHADRCFTVFNGVHADKFVPSTGEPTPRLLKRIGFVGRVSPEKGVHDLLSAFNEVAAQRKDVELHIIGPEAVVPPEWLVDLSHDPLVRDLRGLYQRNYSEQLLERITQEMGGRVHFEGTVKNDELVQRYHDLDILVNPSLSESFGMTVVEAMACGKPVIVAAVGGMKETVQPGRTGLIVPPADPSALAEAILYLLDRDDLRRSMGIEGRSRSIDLYSWDRVTEMWLTACGHSGVGVPVTSGRAAPASSRL